MAEKEKNKNWDAVKRRLQQEHPELTDNDLHYEEGRKEELLERLQKRLNRNKEEIRGWLSFMG
jgi:uncharacterized protein YjbJ (UPF0337 family)